MGRRRRAAASGSGQWKRRLAHQPLTGHCRRRQVCNLHRDALKEQQPLRTRASSVTGWSGLSRLNARKLPVTCRHK